MLLENLNIDQIRHVQHSITWYMIQLSLAGNLLGLISLSKQGPFLMLQAVDLIKSAERKYRPSAFYLSSSPLIWMRTSWAVPDQIIRNCDRHLSFICRHFRHVISLSRSRSDPLSVKCERKTWKFNVYFHWGLTIETFAVFLNELDQWVLFKKMHFHGRSIDF